MNKSNVIKKKKKKNSQYFARPYETFGRDVNVKVDLSNYTTKTDTRNISHVDTSSFALKSNLASLKTEVDKLNTNKLVPASVHLSKIRDVVKNDVFRKTAYDKLVPKVNSIDTSGFVLKTKYDGDKSEIENTIPDISGLIKKTDYNAKITEIEHKIPIISCLATNAALTAVENKTSSISSLVRKKDYDTKFTEIEKKLTYHNHDKYIATSEFNTLAADVFNATLPQANLISDFDAKLSSLNKKISANKSKHLVIEEELKKLKTFDSIYFGSKSHFEEDGTQKYLVFQPMYTYFKLIGNTKFISSWKSKGLSMKVLNPLLHLIIVLIH